MAGLIRWWRGRHRTEVIDMQTALDAFLDGWMTSVKNDPWAAGSVDQFTIGAGALVFGVTLRQWTEQEINDLEAS